MQCRVGRTIAGIIVGAGLWAAACESVPTGPSLSNLKFSGLNGSAIETREGWLASQLPTVFARNSTTVRDPGVCCCHIRGTLTNGNSVPVHVIMQFAAMTAPPERELSRIVNFAQDLQPGATYRIPDDGPGAAGFLLPCVEIDHVNYQLNVSSLAPPLI
jgi:hypothetical protein